MEKHACRARFAAAPRDADESCPTSAPDENSRPMRDLCLEVFAHVSPRSAQFSVIDQPTKLPGSPPQANQPHAKQIAHAPQPSMWSADKEREPVELSTPFSYCNVNQKDRVWVAV
jgi:hypothetical protein